MRCPRAVHRAWKYVPTVSPKPGELLHQPCAAGLGRWFGTRPVQFRANARHEITEVIADKHNDPMSLRDVLPPGNLRPIPVSFARQHDMCVISLDTDFLNLLDDRALLRTRVRIVIDRPAWSIRNEENGNPGLPGGSYEPGYAGYRNRIVCLVIVIHFLVGERGLKGQLKIGAADNGLIDIENYRRREIFGMLLSWHRAPGLVVDESG